MIRVNEHPKAHATFIPQSNAFALSTGSTPGKPRHTGQTCVFGGAPKTAEQPQNSFDAVANCTCTSNPITGSYVMKACLHPSPLTLHLVFVDAIPWPARRHGPLEAASPLQTARPTIAGRWADAPS